MRSSKEREEPATVFHVTHWKAGSQWVRSVLTHAAPDRVIQPLPGPSGPLGGDVVEGGIYTPVYAGHAQFREVVPENPAHRTFVVIRDPRDALVSWYFSLMYSHPLEYATVKESRDELRQLNKADGLSLMIRKHLCEVVTIQREWIESGARIFRYEDLRANQQDAFERIFEFCKLDVPASRRRRIVRRHSFIRRTWWRLGREDVKSHLRKGTPGDWRNHFDDPLKNLFKSHHGQTLVLAGYEKDDSW